MSWKEPPRDSLQDPLKERLAKLSPAKRSLLARLNERPLAQSQLKRSTAAQDVSLVRRSNSHDLVPLGAAQQWLWNIHQAVDPSDTFNSSIQYLVSGRLDVEALEQSVNEIIRRHELLRTAFATVEGRQVQLISPELTQPLLAKVDLSNLPETEREAAVRQLYVETLYPGFDLGNAPLLRVKLIRMGEDEHIFLLVLPRIIIDGLSYHVLAKELETLYSAFCSNRPSPLPELPLQYADYADWEQRWLQSEKAKQQVAYWQQQFEGWTAPNLNTPPWRDEKDAPLIRRGKADLRYYPLSASLSAAIHNLYRSQGSTLYITALTAFVILLYQYTRGQDKLVIAAPRDNRKPETKNLIGCFADKVIFPINLSGNPTCRDLHARVRETFLDTYEYQMPCLTMTLALEPDYDFKDAFRLHRVLCRTDVEDKVIDLDMFDAGAPLVETLRPADVRLNSLNLNYAPSDKSAEALTDAELIFTLCGTPQNLALKFAYDTGLFEIATVDRMLRQLEVLFEKLTADEDQYLSELPSFS